MSLNGEAVAGKSDYAVSRVMQKFHLSHAKVKQNLRALAVIAQFQLRSAAMPQTLGQIARTLADNHNNSLADLLNTAQRGFKSAAVREAHVAENVVKQRKRVNADGGGPVFVRTAGDKSGMLHAAYLIAIEQKTKVAEARLKIRLADARENAVVPRTPRYQTRDRSNLDVMLLRILGKRLAARHRAVVSHNLADDRGRVETGEARKINARLGVSGADENSAVARLKRENMPRRNDSIGRRVVVNRRRDRGRAVVRGNAGADSLARLNGNREGGLVARDIVVRHRRQSETAHLAALKREADETASVSRHEIDALGAAHLRGNDEVGFVLAVFVVKEDDEASVADFLENLGDRRDGDGVRHGGVRTCSESS